MSERCTNCNWLELKWVQISTASVNWHKHCEWCRSLFGPFVKQPPARELPVELDGEGE